MPAMQKLGRADPKEIGLRFTLCKWDCENGLDIRYIRRTHPRSLRHVGGKRANDTHLITTRICRGRPRQENSRPDRCFLGGLRGGRLDGKASASGSRGRVFSLTSSTSKAGIAPSLSSL